MAYIPKVNDYVKWNNGRICLEGWVYFTDKEYCTIEIGVKDKCEENIRHCPIHKKTHCCVVCFPHQWHELEYVKSRSSHCSAEDCYKAQPHRYIDP